MRALHQRLIATALIAGAAVAAGCSGSETPSPTAPTSASVAIATGSESSGPTAAPADGSTLKATAPQNLSPANRDRVDNRRPTLQWAASTGRFLSASGFSYDLELYRNNDLILSRETAGTSYQVESDLASDTLYRWRVRARLGSAFGPWAATADFLTPSGSSPVAGPPVVIGDLPFPIPASCAQGNGSACIVAMTAVSPWWPGCNAGSGVECHRFVRSVAAALASSDPAWGLLSKNPGDTQCNWNSCSIRDGSGYGEDVITYNRGGLQAWDVIVGAGSPGASVQWGTITQFRPGNGWVPVPLPLGTR